MLDIKYIRENPSQVAKKAASKGYPVDITKLLAQDDKKRTLQLQIDDIRRQRNDLSQSLKGRKPTDSEQAIGREYRESLANLEETIKQVEVNFVTALKAVPNMPLPEVPVGASEDENRVIKSSLHPPQFEFQPLSHHQLGEKLDLIDKERATKIAGSRFAYIKGDLVRMQFAIINFVINELTNRSVIERLISDNSLKLDSRPFTPVLPPAVLRTQPYQASSRLDAKEVTYKLEQDDLWLNASAEHTLCTMYMNEILPEELLPIRMLGYSTSFRREAGTYGKDMEGLIRLHQFDKLEMEILSTAETGLDEHRLAVAIQEYLVSKLGLPYQLIEKCTADIGKPNASGFDINCWFPAQNNYRETHTADYMGDYQARDLKIRTRRNGVVELVHTNDATAFAMGRIMAAIMENNQQVDGRIAVPNILRQYMGQELI